MIGLLISFLSASGSFTGDESFDSSAAIYIELIIKCYERLKLGGAKVAHAKRISTKYNQLNLSKRQKPKTYDVFSPFL